MSGAETLETPEESLLAEEVRLACLQGMLLCLSREIRLVPENPCSCAKLIPLEIKIRLLDPENLRFANHRCCARRNHTVDSRLHELDEVKRLAVLFRSHPDYTAPRTFVESIKKLVESGRFQLFSD